jgi:hypothetical protein
MDATLAPLFLFYWLLSSSLSFSSIQLEGREDVALKRRAESNMNGEKDA